MLLLLCITAGLGAEIFQICIQVSPRLESSDDHGAKSKTKSPMYTKADNITYSQKPLCNNVLGNSSKEHRKAPLPSKAVIMATAILIIFIISVGVLSIRTMSAKNTILLNAAIERPA